MTAPSAPLSRHHPRSDRLGLVLALFALLLAPLGLLADKAVVPLSIAAALAGGLALGRPALPWRIIERPLALALGLFFAWCLIASLWSFAPLEGIKLALRVAVLVCVLLYLASLARHLDDRQRRRVALSLACGFAVACLLIVVELAFGGPILNLLEGPTRTDYAADSRLNRGVSAVAILAWPLAAFAWRLRQLVLALALPAAVYVLTLFSESSASVLALSLALPIAALALLGRGAARLLLALAFVGALFATPFVVDLVQRSDLAQSRTIPETGLYRLHIWSVVSDRVTERPVVGWGFDSSPKLPTGDARPFRPGEKIIPSHPHNGGLQIMVELGAIGSLLALAVLFIIAQRIDRLARVERACALGMTITVLGVANSAYGIWQSHWLAVIGGAAVLFVAVQAAPADR